DGRIPTKKTRSRFWGPRRGGKCRGDSSDEESRSRARSSLDTARQLRQPAGTSPAVPWVKRMARMDLRSVLLELHAALDAAGIEHALIGGLALAAHGAGRATVSL